MALLAVSQHHTTKYFKVYFCLNGTLFQLAIDKFLST